MHLWKTSIALGMLALACGGAPDGQLPEVGSPEAITLNSGLQPIDVRYGLDVDDIELAILLAVVNPPETPDLAPGQTITDDVLKKIVGKPSGARRKGHPWTFESRKPGLVFAGYELGSVSMRVAIRFDDQLVMLRIVDSRNLGQNGDHIRGEALTLLGELRSRIEATVITVAQRNRYGVPVPASR